MNTQKLFTIASDWLLSTGSKILIVIVVALIAVQGIRLFSKRLSGLIVRSTKKGDVEYQKRADTLASVIQNLLNVLVLAVALITILGQLGIQIGPVLAAAGVVGLAVGFGAQSLVKDVINGFFILLEDQIRVGDVVAIGDNAGLVERVNLRMTVLRDLSGTVHFIPNGQISIVKNMTKGFSRYVFEIGVAYRENVDEVIAVMKAVDAELRADPAFKDDILEPLEILGLDKFDSSSVVIKAFTTTAPIKQWGIAREFNRRLKKAFDEKNIEIPFPHVTLYMGQDKKGQAPPLPVRLEKPDISS